jgi:hypothetical protein
MVLQGDVGQVKARFGVFRDSVNLGVDRCTVCAECTTAWKSFWAHPMVLLGDMGQVEALSVHLEIVLISALDGSTVCAECTMGMEIILGTPDGIPRWRVSSRSSFWSIWR